MGEKISVCVIDTGDRATHFFVARNSDQLDVKVFEGYVKPRWAKLFGDKPMPTKLAEIHNAIEQCYEVDDCTYWWWGEAEL